MSTLLSRSHCPYVLSDLSNENPTHSNKQYLNSFPALPNNSKTNQHDVAYHPAPPPSKSSLRAGPLLPTSGPFILTAARYGIGNALAYPLADEGGDSLI